MVIIEAAKLAKDVFYTAVDILHDTLLSLEDVVDDDAWYRDIDKETIA